MQHLGDQDVHTSRRARRALLATLLTIGGLGVVAQSAAAAPLGQWRLDEGSGQTVVDDGPFGLDGRLGSSDGADAEDPAWIAGLSGGGLRFDGNAFVRLPDAAELAPATLTVEAVVRGTASPGSFRYVVSRGGQGCFAGAYGLYTAAAGGMAFYAFDGAGYVVTATARPSDVWDGKWHHVAGTYDGSQLAVYIDGRPVGTSAIGPARIDYASTTASAALGRYVGSCDLSYRGDLDFVRLQAGALSPGAVAATANAILNPGLASPPVPLPPLPAADPPVRLEADPPSGPPAVEPGAPARACTLRLSRSRIRARRATAVGVRVTVRGKPVSAVRVVARSHGKRVGVARTNAKGRARLVLRIRRKGRVRISAAVSPACSPAKLNVSKPTAR